MGRYSLSLLPSAFAGLLAVFGHGPVAAAPQPTPAQLEMLRNLTPAQREALARQYGLTPPQATGSEASRPAQEVEAPVETPVVTPEQRAAEDAATRAAAATARDARDLAWCKYEARQVALKRTPESIAAERARAAKAAGYEALEDLPLPGRCDALIKADLEARFTLTPSAAQPFGYDFFRDARTLVRGDDLPVPADYSVGPGDSVEVQLFGKDNAQYSLVVGRDGRLNFPGLGPIPVAGLNFAAMHDLLQKRVAQQMIGVQASITLGALRSIRVFVVGEVERPGSHTISSLGTMTTALYAAGGVKTSGSLRDIQLKRDGKLVGRLDLYDLLTRGDTQGDLRLRAGDAVFIPPVGPTATVEGEVVRPAVFELRGSTSVGQLLDLAGGLTPDAYPQDALLERITSGRERTVLDLDLSAAGAREQAVRGGDRLQVASVLDHLEAVVRVVGHVHRPRFAEWREGLRLTDLLPDAGVLKPKADLEYLMIRRELAPSREIIVLSANLAKALAAPGGADDLVLRPRDQVFTFGIDADRVLEIQPVLEELRAQARKGQPARVVSISGSVRAPGEYPLEPGMRVSDLLRAAGQLAENAFVAEAEITRFVVVDGNRREIAHSVVDLAAIFNGNPDADIALQAFDQLNIRPVANWHEVETVEVRGEVRFPGFYPIQKGETLQSVLKRAGGFTEYAFPAGAVFTRVELQRREQEQLDRLAERLSRELTALSLEQAQSQQSGAEALRLGEQVAREVRGVQALGRLVLDLAAVADGQDEVIARAGDRLIIPRQTQEVTVLGEVQYATSHLYEEGASRQSYIERSGGFTVKADKSRVFVVRANGQVDSAGRSSRIEPGDTIVAPLDTERMRPLVFWSTISQIVYQIALTAASAKTVGAF